MRLRCVSETKGAVDDRSDSSGREERPYTGFQVARKLTFLFDRAYAQRRSGDGQSPAHDAAEIDLRRVATLQANLNQAAFEAETLDVADEVIAADDVEDDVDSLARGFPADDLTKILRPVVDGDIGAKLTAGIALRVGSSGRKDCAFGRACELNGGGADSAGAAVDQDALARLKPA